MSKNFHESFAQGELKPPSERNTGFVFAAVAVVIAALWRNSPPVLSAALAAALLFASVSLFKPKLLTSINMLWFRFGLLLQQVMNPIVLFALFAFVFVPAGAIMRLWYDPLRSRRLPEGSSYWIDRRSQVLPRSSMRNQF